MSNLVKINDYQIAVKEYKGQRVVTFKDIDLCHKRPEGTARRNFSVNRQHLIENTDYFLVKPSDFRKYEKRTSGIEAKDINNRGTAFITESGYLMLAKSFTDDLAWDVQRALVSYFEGNKNTQHSNTNSPASRQRLISSVNHEADNLRKVFEAAGINPKFTAIHVAELYRTEAGQNIPVLPIESEKTYDRTEIAQQLGIYSKSGKPHSSAIGAILKNLDVSDNMVIHSSFSRNGHDSDYDRYKVPVLDMVSAWLKLHGKTSPIVLDKSYNVVYQ